ncbi:MAG: molybdopterin-synthase adenylyltransferase MoeB [Ignavibacteriaceae bacterium]
MLSNTEILRYSRHLLLPEIGIDGQELIKNSKVLIVGAGGTGSAAAMYLASSGVGEIGLIDFDRVDLSNLQRQIIHSTNDVGRKKVESAHDTITGLNPDIEVKTYDVRLSNSNAIDILSEYDIIADCSDNFPANYLINDASVLLGKPDVYGSVFRFEGKVTVFDSGRGPCYRCLYEVPPPPEMIPNCEEGGVLSILPGIIGTLQALEIIKLIIKKGELLTGRVLLFDALQMKFNEIKLEKNPDCIICGENPVIHELIDYDQFCGSEKHEIKESDEITPDELKQKTNNSENIFILDIRNQQEYKIVNIGGYCIPLDQLTKRLSELDPSREIVVCCKTGRRSKIAVKLLKEKGFNNVKNLKGGIIAWIELIDNTLPGY